MRYICLVDDYLIYKLAAMRESYHSVKTEGKGET